MVLRLEDCVSAGSFRMHSDCARRMYEAAELRKGSARPTLSEKELVASEKVRFIEATEQCTSPGATLCQCEELPLFSLAGRPLRVLSQKAT